MITVLQTLLSLVLSLGVSLAMAQSPGFLKLETISASRDLEAETQKAVMDKLTADPSLAESLKTIKVSMKDSVIVLSGSLSTAKDRSKIIEHVKSISAANRIIDNIE